MTQIIKEYYIFKRECYDIIGCCMEVNSELECGFLEAIYQEALELSFMDTEIPFEREIQLDVYYKGR